MIDLLVLDDDLSFLHLLEDFFTPEGVSIRGFTHAISALASLQACPPDALVLDLMLPQFDGISLYQKLRADADTDCLPIVISTAATHLLPTLDTDNDAWCTVLAKPYTLNELQSSLDQLLVTTH